MLIEVPEPWMLAQQDDWRQLRPIHAALAFVDLMALWMVLEMVKGNDIKMNMSGDGKGFTVEKETR